MLNVDPILALLGQAIEASSLRHSVHTSNIANAEVEGYQPLDVVVDERLQADTEIGGRETVTLESRVVTSSETTVQLDQEMASMAQNAVRYQALLNAVERTMSMLRYAAREGREG